MPNLFSNWEVNVVEKKKNIGYEPIDYLKYDRNKIMIKVLYYVLELN